MADRYNVDDILEEITRKKSGSGSMMRRFTAVMTRSRTRLTMRPAPPGAARRRTMGNRPAAGRAGMRTTATRSATPVRAGSGSTMTMANTRIVPAAGPRTAGSTTTTRPSAGKPVGTRSSAAGSGSGAMHRTRLLLPGPTGMRSPLAAAGRNMRSSPAGLNRSAAGNRRMT